MATIQERNGSFRLLFLYRGKRRAVTLGKVSRNEAEGKAGATDLLLLRIKQGLISVPAGVTIEDFILHDGRVEPRPDETPAPGPVTFSAFRERYLEAHGDGAMEASSLATVGMHLSHFGRSLGDRFRLGELTLADLQRHVNERRRKKYRGRPLSTVTLRKEVASFRAAWNWAAVNGMVRGAFPSKGLVYPKSDEKPPFMTRDEIERRSRSTDVSGPEGRDLWDSLYLRKAEVEELLAHVKQHATAAWLYPIVSTAAYTGARRSELLRIEVADVDLEGKMLLVREKKRSRKQRTTRHVALTPALAVILREWLASHPGGRFLFCQAGVIARSKKRSGTTGHCGENTRESSLKGRLSGVRRREAVEVAAVTRDEAHDHLKRTLAGSRWAVLRGYHVLRHSFISCLATAGVDQRVIDDFVGHCSEEQRRRYRHLVPDLKQRAIAGVFG